MSEYKISIPALILTLEYQSVTPKNNSENDNETIPALISIPSPVARQDLNWDSRCFAWENWEPLNFARLSREGHFERMGAPFTADLKMQTRENCVCDQTWPLAGELVRRGLLSSLWPTPFGPASSSRGSTDGCQVHSWWPYPRTLPKYSRWESFSSYLISVAIFSWLPIYGKVD